MYSEKYFLEYCKDDAVYRLSIFEWDYEGDASEITGAPVPFTKTRETSSELKVGGIFPTTATLTLVSSPTFNMEELYTADEKKYLVQNTNQDGTGEGDFIGNIVPNGFYEQMDDNVHYMVLTASDNTATLRGLLFTEADGTNYGAEGSSVEGDFIQSFMWVAKEALEKTGLLLPIWTLVDVRPALDNFTVPVQISIDVSSNIITLVDASLNVKNNIQNGYRLTVVSGTGAGLSVVIGSYSVVEGVTLDRIDITPVGALPGTSILGNAVIELAPVVADPSAVYGDPLAITVHDIRTYVNDLNIEGTTYYEVYGAAKTTWEVLDNLAKQWNAEIYQNNGRWEIVRINAHMLGDGEYQYFTYNSEGVQIGREDFGVTIDFPCGTLGTAIWRPYDHQIGMDRVLARVGVNYRYKYKTEGDSLVNLIKNGNLSPPSIIYPPPTMDPNTYTPEYWQRFGGTSPNTMSLQFHGLPSVPGEYPPAGIPYVTMGTVGERFYGDRYLCAGSGYVISVGQGDELKLSFWYRARYRTVGSGFNSLNLLEPLVIRVLIYTPNAPDNSGRYQLVNNGARSALNIATATPAELSSPVKVPSQWVQYQQHNDDWLALEVGSGTLIGASIDNQKGPWVKYEVEMEPVPQAGILRLEITGTGEPRLGSGMYTYSVYDPMGTYRNRTYKYSDRSGDIAGFFMAKMVDPSSEAVPQIHAYMYPEPAQQNARNYTDTIGDIEVLTGDDGNPDHVSNIFVMDGTTQRVIKSWDTWASDFGWGALGLILAKSVMQQYWVPWRIIDGAFVAPGINWATRFTFGERPGERYKILRGTLDPINDVFNGTLVQVFDEDSPTLPPGGSDGGGTVDPNWQSDGTSRCARNEDGENTGEVEERQVDTNAASPTYGQVRWVLTGEDTDTCPIGEPIELYWGADDLSVDLANMEYSPYEKNGDDYTVKFDNDGSGKYLWFLHRASIGTVQSIKDPIGYEAYGSLPSWQYQADMIIGGYTYKVMRMIYPSGFFTDLPKIFRIT